MDAMHLAGVDAVKLVVMIVQAAQTVRHNKKTCLQLVHRVQMIGDLLKKLQNSEMMQQPEIRNPVKGLEEILLEAYMLVSSCQNSNYIYRFFMGGKQADQFHVVQNKIDSYLLLFPVISHIDTVDHLDHQILNTLRPSHSQAAEDVPWLFTGCSNHSATSCSPHDARIEVCGKIERVHAVTGPFTVKEGHQAGTSNVVQAFSTKQSRMRHNCCGHRMESPTINRFNGHEAGPFKFNFPQLVDATKNFSPENKIGHGSFGCVYKGRLHNGLEVAIKRRSEVPLLPSQLDFRNLEFGNEICFLTKLQHTNIVKLLGCCIHERERMLVYEYMPNGSFDSFIFGARTRVNLEWPTCFQIMKGIAEGLVYLHKQCGLYIIHGDLKPSNILLDSDMNPKISDFGRARIYSPGVDEEFADRIMGSIGFLAPEYRERGVFSVKSDVYGFGALLLEIISGKRCFSLASGGDYGFLNKRAWELWNAGRLIKLVGSLLRDESHRTEIMRCIQIALLCVEESPANRPTMQEAVLMLSCQSVALPTPQRPAYLAAENGVHTQIHSNHHCT